MSAGRAGFTTRASCLLAAGGTALLCGLLLGIVDLARVGVLALAVPLISAFVVLRSRLLIANRRAVEPARVSAGETVVVNLTITNRSLLPSGGLMLEDQLPVQMHGTARFVLDGLNSRESRTVSYRMPRLPRGRYRAGPLHVRFTDPFHLVDIRRSFTGTDEITVSPVVEQLRGVDPPRSMDVGDDAGSHAIGARGADDASTREYRTGDALRKIHWRSSARTGALMVRQEERPWQGQLNVLLDMRSGAHMGREDDASGGDDRQRSSFEWAVSAAATVATHGVLTGRDVGLLGELTTPGRLPVLGTTQIADYLAVVRPSPRTTLDALDGLLGPVARESTVVAVLGELDDRSLRMLASVHPRRSSSNALALLLDVMSWARGPDGIEMPVEPRIQSASRVLRAAGWQTHIARCGDSIAGSVQSLLASSSTGGLMTLGRSR